ncbi:cutinase family protein [Actinomadura algeriensis]|uniref:Cutinase n=1 Tax=Actinomadura algeriensis TaxID=1679523 RepID=A0ABR9K332_9ACTN|nr:cutinase family protein [Actinomadura algeriensis]MBE1537018.1 cutinase [Actinomadura algeriensis]
MVKSFITRAAAQVAALTGAAGAVSVFGAAAPASAAECKPVSIISSRGTFEPQDGSWLQKPIGDKIAAALPGQTKYTELEYPALPNFDTSPEAGVTALVKLLNTEAAACPDQRYVLIGYSQGAQVTGDSLVPPADRLVGKNAGEVSAAAAAKISAIVLYGNPRFVAGEPYNAGTPEPGKSGDKPRTPGELAAYATRIKDYCSQGDFVCQKGGGVLAHLTYFFNGMNDQGAQFAVEQLKTS